MRHSKSIIGAWKKQLFDINGFNEQFVGWGREDSDLVYRLIQSGMKRKLGHFALCVTHLHHPPHDRGLNNDDMLARTIKNSDNHFPGIGQYLS